MSSTPRVSQIAALSKIEIPHAISVKAKSLPVLKCRGGITEILSDDSGRYVTITAAGSCKTNYMYFIQVGNSQFQRERQAQYKARSQQHGRAAPWLEGGLAKGGRISDVTLRRCVGMLTWEGGGGLSGREGTDARRQACPPSEVKRSRA